MFLCDVDLGLRRRQCRVGCRPGGFGDLIFLFRFLKQLGLDGLVGDQGFDAVSFQLVGFESRDGLFHVSIGLVTCGGGGPQARTGEGLFRLATRLNGFQAFDFGEFPVVLLLYLRDRNHGEVFVRLNRLPDVDLERFQIPGDLGMDFSLLKRVNRRGLRRRLSQRFLSRTDDGDDRCVVDVIGVVTRRLAGAARHRRGNCCRQKDQHRLPDLHEIYSRVGFGVASRRANTSRTRGARRE